MYTFVNYSYTTSAVSQSIQFIFQATSCALSTMARCKFSVCFGRNNSNCKRNKISKL